MIGRTDCARFVRWELSYSQEPLLTESCFLRPRRRRTVPSQESLVSVREHRGRVTVSVVVVVVVVCVCVGGGQNMLSRQNTIENSRPPEDLQKSL
jgi:hypothetical protein